MEAVVNVCEAGHKSHKHRVVSTIQGPMHVWDWDLYCGTRGYCTGQDDVSRTLALYGVWEPEETRQVRAYLERFPDQNGVVLDVGAHIGWFTRLAAGLGYQVHAYEGDRENLGLLWRNVGEQGLSDLVTGHGCWVGPDTCLDIPDGPIRLVKGDIEGAEIHLVRQLEPALADGRIGALFLEISPCFNGSYPALVDRLDAYGYRAFRGARPFDGNWDFAQDNFWFRRSA